MGESFDIKKSMPAIIGGMVIGVIIGAVGMFILTPNKQDDSAESSPNTASTKNISALGRIQPAGGLLTLTTPMPDQVVKIGDSVEEGKTIKKDAEIVVLSGNAEHKLKWELAKIQLADAKKQRESIEKSSQLKIEAEESQIEQIEKLGPFKQKLQSAKIEFLKKKLDTAKENLEKVKGLAFVSNQEKEEKQLLILGLENQLEAAKLEQEQMAEGHQFELKAANAALAASKAKKEQMLQQLSIESLEKNIALAKSMYERTIVRAPISGKVIALFAQVGELVGGMQPILTMADTDNMNVVAEVYETDRHRLSLGQKVEITGRAIKDGKLTGKVVHISDRIGRNKVSPANPLEKTDRRVVEVKIALDDSTQAASLINHQVTVTFLSDE